MTSIFKIDPNAKVTYINKKKNELWDNWKLYKDCSKEEKEKINLSQYPDNCILFDRDLKDYSKEAIEKDYAGFVKMLNKRQINSFFSYYSPHGYHAIAPFEDMDSFEDDLKKELRKYYVSFFSSDPAKISDRGVVSLPNRPHFKNEVIYNIKDNYEGLNTFPESVLDTCKKRVANNKKIKNKLLADKDFTSYFEDDPFFVYVKSNIIKDGTNRDMILFPNIAIAAVKSGKDKSEIDKIMRPIIQKNFPGKAYSEFEGWYKKALKGDIEEYNPILINNWMNEHSELKLDIYDLKDISVEDSLKIADVKEDNFKIYWDDELHQIKNTNVDWVIDKWIPKGDICFIAGKAASYKTTICLHWAYCLANDKLVFNNYKVQPSRVLYMNEENSNSVLVNIVKRVKTGLEITNGSRNIAFSLLNNIRFDIIEDINKLVEFINKNKIDVIFFDSFRRFFLGEENDATLMNRLFNVLKHIRSKTDTTLIIIHHAKKSSKADGGDIRDSLRGSSDIVNSADNIIEVSRKHGHQAFTIQHIKNRSGEEMTNKTIVIDGDEESNSAYMYETKDNNKAKQVMNAYERIAVQIVNYLDSSDVMEFTKADIVKVIEAKAITISRALKLLEEEESITLEKKGKLTKYFYSKSNYKEENTEKQAKL